jgi:hypothetical protein
MGLWQGRDIQDLNYSTLPYPACMQYSSDEVICSSMSSYFWEFVLLFIQQLFQCLVYASASHYGNCWDKINNKDISVYS